MIFVFVFVVEKIVVVFFYELYVVEVIEGYYVDD